MNKDFIIIIIIIIIMQSSSGLSRSVTQRRERLGTSIHVTVIVFQRPEASSHWNLS